MTPVEQFQRYVWLVDTLYSFGPLTKEEIDHKWMNNTSANHGRTASIPDRTFRRDLRAIESIFGIDYKCDRATNRYHIETELKDKSFSRWAVETMAMSQFVAESKDISKQILVEDMPSGYRYLTPIVKAMKSHHSLTVSYQSYFAASASQFEIEPYCLKSFKRRWYVLAKSSKHEELRVFALDRFVEMTPTDKQYSMPRNFDGEKYFKDYYGVILNEKPEKVRLWTTSFRANYLRSLPLHKSQKEVECVPESVPQANDGYSIFEMKVAPTFDFIQELRSLGAEVKVLAPQRLADWLKCDAENVVKLYKE